MLIDRLEHMFLNSNLVTKASTTTENTFAAKQIIENSNIGVESPALVIRARTDQNQYARPAIHLDCYGTVGGSLFLDADGKLKIKIGEVTHTINMT